MDTRPCGTSGLSTSSSRLARLRTLGLEPGKAVVQFSKSAEVFHDGLARLKEPQ